MQKEEKLFVKYLVAILFALMMFCTVLMRASFYRDDGLPREGEGASSRRVVGENLAGSFALLKAAEDDREFIAAAYDPDIQSAYLSERFGIQGDFYAFSAPTLPFLAVPAAELTYSDFFDLWLAWGFFLFSASLLCLFPLFQTILLAFAFPALFYAFSFGGGGLFYAAALIFIFSKAQKFPKMAGFFGGLTVVSPLYFAAVLAVLFIRKQLKAGIIAAAFGGFIVIMTLNRYGIASFQEAGKAAWMALNDFPCSFVSLYAAVKCSGLSAFPAAMMQAAAVVWAAAVGMELYRNPKASQNVRNAYLCSALFLCLIFATEGEYGVLCASAGFLMCDIKNRGWSGGFEKLSLAVLFCAPFLEPVTAYYFGFRFVPLLPVALISICQKRAL